MGGSSATSGSAKDGIIRGRRFRTEELSHAIDRRKDRSSPTAQGSAAAFEEGWSGIEPKTAGFQVPQSRETGCRARSQKGCNDWQWKQARMLLLTFDMLVFETLNLRAMQQLWGRKVGDLGFADFLSKAGWMATKLGRDLVKIDQWEATTKSCHLCGYRQDMPLITRTFECRSCGNVEDRDLNAAYNIWEAGRRLRTATSRKTAHGRQDALVTAESH